MNQTLELLHFNEKEEVLRKNKLDEIVFCIFDHIR